MFAHPKAPKSAAAEPRRVRFGLLAALCVLVLAVAASCSGDPDAREREPDATLDASDDGASADVDSTESWGEFPDDDRDQLQSQLDLAVSNLGLPGAAIAVARVPERTMWVGASGNVAPDSTEAWDVDRLFRIGSVTKTFTTAIVLQLVSEGVVSLDDPLERWVPGYYDDQGVTVRHLVTNTSGIVSYNYVGEFDESREWTPEELVQWAVDHEPDVQFVPGSDFDYSNTNFVLLGMLIEAATEGTYADAVESRLLEPLGLAQTYVASAGDDNPRIVPAFDADGREMTDAADPSMGYSAGAIATTPGDLARWAAALYGGEVLTDEMLGSMTTPAVQVNPGEQYGMGAFIEGEGAETTIGHSGGIGGYLTYMYYLESEATVVVVMTNVRDTDLRELAAYGWSVVLGVPYP